MTQVVTTEPTRAQPVAPAVSVTMQIELAVRLPAAPDSRERVRATLTHHGIAILAASPYMEGQSRRWMLVVDDALRATVILHEAGIPCDSETVVFIESPAHSNAAMRLGTTLMGHGIGILHSYVTPADNDRLAAVFRTTDDRRALELLSTLAAR